VCWNNVEVGTEITIHHHVGDTPVVAFSVDTSCHIVLGAKIWDGKKESDELGVDP
jgi:hypothetical protein